MWNPHQDARIKKMEDMGLTFNGDSFVFKDINFHWTDLLCMTDPEFDKAYAGAIERKKILDAETIKKEEV